MCRAQRLFPYAHTHVLTPRIKMEHNKMKAPVLKASSRTLPINTPAEINYRLMPIAIDAFCLFLNFM